MKTRAYVMLGIALLLAGASVFLARNWVQNQVQPVAAIESQKRLETTKVIVASTQLHFGNKVRREHLRVVDWPTAAVPEGSFKSIDDILGKEEVDEKTGVKKKAKDRTALRTIEVNEPILKSKITGFGGRASLSTLIAPGMRATTIRVNDVSGVAGFVLPGDRVDVLLTRDPESGKRRGNNLQTDVFLQNMKVLAIAQDANQDRNKAAVVKAVTLEVTPTQAQKLTLAQKLGSLSLALRHVNTVNAEAPQSIKARDLNVGEANLAPETQGPRCRNDHRDGRSAGDLRGRGARARRAVKGAHGRDQNGDQVHHEKSKDDQDRARPEIHGIRRHAGEGDVQRAGLLQAAQPVAECAGSGRRRDRARGALGVVAFATGARDAHHVGADHERAGPGTHCERGRQDRAG